MVLGLGLIPLGVECFGVPGIRSRSSHYSALLDHGSHSPQDRAFKGESGRGFLQENGLKQVRKGTGEEVETEAMGEQ